MLLQETARAYHEAGLQVLPVRYGEKKPISAWKEYTFRPQTSDEITNLFPEGQNRNIAILGGEVSRNFLALDFDDRKAFIRAVSSSPALARVASTTPLVNTARGVHVYLRTPVPVASSKIEDLSLDIKAEGGYVVAPPSLHRSGQLYLFADGWKLINEVPLDFLPFLNLRPFTRAPDPGNVSPEYADIYRGSGFYGLGERASIILAGKIPKGKRSEEEARVIFTCVRNGWTFPQVAELFERHAARGTHFREHATPWKYLRLVYTSAEAKLKAERRTVDLTIDSLAEAFARYPYASRTAWTDRAVSEAVLSIARRTGKLQLAISERELAELAGVTRITARKSLGRLPLIRIHGPNISGQVYELPSVDSLPRSPLVPLAPVKEWDKVDNRKERPILAKSEDAARRGALGKNGLAILQALRLDRALTVKEIAEASGVPWRTAYRKLERILYAGAAFKEGAAYRLARKLDARLLDDIAEHFGTKGARELQRAQHAREREAFKRAREEGRA